ncbi:type II toxin-antitoxin system Phd/YefM family antitoxin [Roseibium denhamense]|uniref:Antitoxin n=1 Tax=Roseibium denhamense TaxID=76305 RepID=A0ABY1PMF8_9HYPH|nr:type II toxin-antitoxin system Phd/YefM family antitoxin [Roseibium denhamense]SMP37424.1 prevent-host-death family protein [Roseibium denhamense]
MPTTSLSSREFNQDIGRAKKAAQNGPVVITDRGKPAHVLMTIDEYQKLTRQRQSLVDRLSMPDLSDVEFEPGRADITLREADLS